MNINLAIFNLLHNLSGQSVCLNLVGIFLAQYLILLFPALIFIIWFLGRKKIDLLKLIILIFGSISLTEILNLLIKSVYFNPRPFVVLKFTALINVLPTESSFPSAHTSTAFVFALILFSLNKKIGIISLFLALVVGLARIFVGVHWPSDVLGGIIVGCLGFIITKKIINKLLI